MTIQRGLVSILILFILIWTTVFTAHVDLRFKRQERKRSCLTSVGTGGTCVNLRQCRLRSKTGVRIKPSLCWWDYDAPVICCPNPESLNCGISREQSLNIVKRQTTFEGPGTEGEDKYVDGFIIGGVNARQGRWPWMGLIFLEDDANRKSPICGASLISDQSLLTAAHCFLGRSNSKIVIRLGEHNLKNRSGHNAPIEMKVKNVIEHEGFHYPSLYNDVAIVQLESKVQLSNNIATVCLPENLKNENFVGKTAIVTGWGLLGFGGRQAQILQELEVPVISNEACKKKYDTISGAEVNLPQGVPNTLLCAGYENERKDSCQGDSGGPLVYRTAAGNWGQIGIVSAGYDCGSGIPGLYTRVTEYLDWIKKNTI